MNAWLRFLMWLIIGAAALAALVWAFMPAPAPVDLAVAEVAPLQITVDEDGKTRVKERYIVSAPLAGQLLRIQLKAGDKVEAGKTLVALIEPSDPELLDVRVQAESQARLQMAQAAAEQANTRIAAANEAYELARSRLYRARALEERNVFSREELEVLEHAERIAAEDQKAAVFAKQVADFEVELAKAALIRTRGGEEENGGETAAQNHRFPIHSPVDGNVLRVIEESARIVAPSLPLIEVGDATDLEVEVDVLSSDAARIRPGAKVLLEHWGGDQPLNGRVRLIEPSGFTKISALGVEEQRVNVIIDLTDPVEAREALGDAFRVETRIVIWEKDDVLQIPAGALFRDGAEWAVYAVKDGAAELRHVDVGRNNGLAAEILSGLEAGEQVVLHPSDKITPGARVRPRRGE